MNETWQAVSREAGIAAEHIGIGVTALGKANYAHHAYYGQAFFALSVGFERSAKLAVVVDHALENDGAFSSHHILRRYGHDLKELLGQADKIAERRGLARSTAALPDSKIHGGIVDVLSSFATNETRYYNLDFLTGDPAAAQREDPTSSWFKRVTLEVLKVHYNARHREKHESDAMHLAQLLEGRAVVAHVSETGEDLRSIFDSSFLSNITEFAKPYTRMYVLQIARFLAKLMSNLGRAGYSLTPHIIPDLSEFFRVFDRDDRDFKRLKTWSIH